jgi:hypothetical protein
MPAKEFENDVALPQVNPMPKVLSRLDEEDDEIEIVQIDGNCFSDDEDEKVIPVKAAKKKKKKNVKKVEKEKEKKPVTNVYDKDFYVYCWESVDAEKLDTLLKNKKKLDKDVIGMLNNIKKWKLDKKTGIRKKKVLYEQKYGGRLYPKGESVVYLPSNYRNHLCQKLYHDVDIVNSMVSILLNKCVKMGIENCKTLEHYVNNRESCLEKIARRADIERDDAKELVLMATFGAGIDMLEHELEKDVPKEVLAIKKEVEEIRYKIVRDQKYKDFIEQIKRDASKKKLESYWEGSYLSFILAREEWNIIRCMKDFFKKNDWEMGFIEFDGMKIKCKKDEGLPQSLIWECEKHIKEETGMDIKLKIKPMDTTIAFKEEDSEYTDSEYLNMKREFELTNFKVTHNPTCFVTEMKNQLGQTILVKKTKALFEIANEELQIDDETFFSIWKDDPNKRVYHTIDFLPGLEDCPDGVYNTFRGYNAQLIPKEEVMPNDGLELIYQHIRYLCEDDSTVFMKFLDLIAYKLQNPLTLIPILWIFYGEQGCGKNILIDWIGQSIFGNDYYTTDTLTNIMDKYGNLRENKLLINVDELSMSESKKHEEQMKRLITQQMLSIEEKYIPKQTTRNVSLHIGTTNNENCLTLKSGDRRPKVYQCSNKPKGNFQYFKDLKKAMDDKEVQNLFFTAMMRRQVTDSILDETSYPESQIQKEMKQRNLPKIYNYIKDTYMDNYVKVFWKGSTLLHDDYKDYISKRFPNNTPMAITPFGITMKKIFEKRRKKKGIGYTIDKRKWDAHLLEKGIVFDEDIYDDEYISELEEDM